MLWIKSLHIIFIISWFAGLFYLPRLFVHHAMVPSGDVATSKRLKIMERKLFLFITPLGVLAIGFGVWLWLGYGFGGGWLHLKVTLTLALVAFNIYCGKLVADFKHDRNCHGHVFYRWLNEFPTLVLFAVVPLTVIKPF